MECFADIIIDISHSRLDQTFQYRVPEALQSVLEPGNVVEVPFGRGDRPTKGYVMRITDYSSCPPEKLKEITRIETKLAGAESKLTALALWMRDYYGCTTVQALRTVLPFRQKAAQRKKKTVVLKLPRAEALAKLDFFRKKHQTARARLLEALVGEGALPYEVVTGSLKITAAVLHALEEQGVIACESEQVYRTPAVLRRLRAESESAGEIGAGQTEHAGEPGWPAQHAGEPPQEAGRAEPPDGISLKKNPVRIHLNHEQQRIVDTVLSEWDDPDRREYLIHGVTGSGKTAVYMELIDAALRMGRQAILLIPEISLTYQNVIRFYHRFGDRISILHSRLSQAERYDQFERARTGDIDVMIGPRSALFTPFQKLGIIIIDEEHESSYKSEAVPRYHARETAQKRAALEGAKLVLGSATPSLEAYFEAESGRSRLFTMEQRATGGTLPEVRIVDMCEELREGNRSIVSGALYERMDDRLKRGQQIMLFLNRRGYSGFVSCRSCGHVIKCPHCDVSLSLHRNGKLVCHYCGYERPAVSRCPECDSPYIGGFKIGTQQVEEMVRRSFPDARVLRMDADTTRGQDGHAEILRAFGSREADILIGTQMIVKGHDFPHVTLVGILAADLSLNVSDYQAAERTFELLTQAAGRAGRGAEAGEVVIQTYVPENYAIRCAAIQDYLSFYRQEMEYRALSGYPPAGGMMALHCFSEDSEKLGVAVSYLAKFTRRIAQRCEAAVIGPADEAVAKVNDVYRKILYVKHPQARVLTAMKNMIEQYIEINTGFQEIRVQFERK